MEVEEVTLIDEAGVEQTYLVHDVFETGGFTYYLVEAAGDPDQVLLLKEVSGSLESVEAEEFERVLGQLEAEAEETR